jgi:hypothetical protein
MSRGYTIAAGAGKSFDTLAEGLGRKTSRGDRAAMEFFGRPSAPCLATIYYEHSTYGYPDVSIF